LTEKFAKRVAITAHKNPLKKKPALRRADVFEPLRKVISVPASAQGHFLNTGNHTETIPIVVSAFMPAGQPLAAHKTAFSMGAIVAIAAIQAGAVAALISSFLQVAFLFLHRAESP
jgi:hypothetical protein